jgi:hypothetical protein
MDDSEETALIRSQINDLRLAASKMNLVDRRDFQASMTLKYYGGKARLAYTTYHSKYNPIERCWGILEQHWNGTLLRDVQILLAWAQNMIWKGIHPIVQVNDQIYEKGISPSKRAMREVERSLKRNSELRKWDILIQPAKR